MRQRGERMGNKRQFFRVDFYDVEVTAIAQREKHHGRIRDLSGNGISFYLQDKVDFTECIVEFALEKQTYTLDAVLIRREYTAFGEYVYACTFTSIDERTQSGMMSILLKLDAKRRKK